MSALTQRQLFLSHVAQTSDMPFMGHDMNVVKAEGCKLIDANGKEYIDLISGISVSNVGHCHPKVLAAISEQSKRYMHLMVYGEYNQKPQVEYASLICKYLPKSLNSVYFTTGGSESIEGAMKLAKRATGRSKIVAFRNAYHGSTQGSLSLMSDESFKQAFRPLIPGVIHLDYNTSDLSLIDKGVAAVFVEPIQGEAGVVEPTNDFLKKLRNRCNEVGALLVFDEIQTGFGRTGKLFAFEHYEIVPDILCAAKGMGGGLPIGAFIADIKLMQSLSNNPILGHINTFGGNAVCVEAARAALDVIINDNLINRAVEIESYFKANLKHSKIKQLRIKGALGAIEFENTEQAFKVCKKLIEAGIVTDWFLFNSNSLRISPPLVITDEELKSAVIDIIKVLDGNP